MKKTKSILRIIVFAFISIIIGLKLYSWNAKHLVGNRMPMPFGYGFSVVLSGSMEPELNVNDFVIIKKLESYQQSDIVVYQDESSLVIHRIIDMDEETAVTKGDANEIADAPIKISAIKGKLIASVPSIGLIIRFLQSPVGIILILALAIFMFVSSDKKEKASANAKIDAIKQEIRALKEQMDSETEKNCSDEKDGTE